MRAVGLVRRIGVNFNQAVAKLNATGQYSGDLLPYAQACMRRVDHLDAVAEQLRKAIREIRMAFRPRRMIHRAADRVPPMRMAIQDQWTAIRPARTIIRDG